MPCSMISLMKIHCCIQARYIQPVLPSLPRRNRTGEEMRAKIQVGIERTFHRTMNLPESCKQPIRIQDHPVSRCG